MGFAAVIFFLLFFGLFAVVMLAVVGVLVWQLVLKPKRDQESWEKAAQALGLRLDPNSSPDYQPAMMGTSAGLPLRVRARRVVTGSGKNRRVTYYTRVGVDFPTPLGMGLTIQPQSHLKRMWERVAGASGITVGDPRLDPHFELRGVDVDQVQRLVRLPYITEGLLMLVGRAFKLHVQDHRLYLEAAFFAADPALIRPVLDTAAAFAHRLLSARAEVGDSTSQQRSEDALRELAGRLALTYDRARSMAHGRLEGMHVEADAVVVEQSRQTRFAVRFDRALGMRLELTPQGTLHTLAKLVGMQDIETGDTAFDDRFVVKGQPVDRVRAALTPDVRQRLSALQDQSVTLVIQDDRIEAWAGYPMYDVSQLEMGLTAMARVGAAVAGVQHRPIGPFRG
ncbi:MAG: hypothetical protein AB8I08_19805 [Sandaracinaceae bacterium]